MGKFCIETRVLPLCTAACQLRQIREFALTCRHTHTGHSGQSPSRKASELSNKSSCKTINNNDISCNPRIISELLTLRIFCLSAAVCARVSRLISLDALLLRLLIWMTPPVVTGPSPPFCPPATPLWDGGGSLEA